MSEPWAGGEYGDRGRCVLAPNPGIMTLDGTNTWVLREPGAERSIVVDPGPLDDAHLDAVAAAAGQVDQVVVTHHHIDHTEAARSFAERMGCGVRALDPDAVLAGGPGHRRRGDRRRRPAARGAHDPRPHLRLDLAAGRRRSRPADRRHGARPRHDGDRPPRRRPRRLLRLDREDAGPGDRRPGRRALAGARAGAARRRRGARPLRRAPARAARARSRPLSPGWGCPRPSCRPTSPSTPPCPARWSRSSTPTSTSRCGARPSGRSAPSSRTSPPADSCSPGLPGPPDRRLRIIHSGDAVARWSRPDWVLRQLRGACGWNADDLETMRADVCVVGAGIAGLNALHVVESLSGPGPARGPGRSQRSRWRDVGGHLRLRAPPPAARVLHHRRRQVGARAHRPSTSRPRARCSTTSGTASTRSARRSS